MEKLIKSIDMALEHMINQGASSGQCIASVINVDELNAESGEFSLLRTINSKTSFRLSSFVDGKMGTSSTGSLKDEDILDCAKTCVNLSHSSIADPANGMNESGEKITVENRNTPESMEKLIKHTDDFLKLAAEQYPIVNLRQTVVKYISGYEIYKNTFGTTIITPVSHYSFSSMFLSKENEKISSFSSTHFSFENFDKPFIEMGLLKQMLENSQRQIETQAFGEKKRGALIIAPQCLNTFMRHMINAFMSGPSVIAGVNRWRNSIDSQVANTNFSLSASPLDSRLVQPTAFTKEGFPVGNQDIIKNGNLLTLLPDLYTSNKTGLPRSANYGSGLIVEGGDKTIDDMIKDVTDGVLMYRFSGGVPQASGDFSGIAKNSFIIRNGAIAGAAKETTVSGNMADMLLNIRGISSQTICDGSSVMPYISFDGITIR